MTAGRLDERRWRRGDVGTRRRRLRLRGESAGIRSTTAVSTPPNGLNDLVVPPNPLATSAYAGVGENVIERGRTEALQRLSVLSITRQLEYARLRSEREWAAREE